jgi:hypothetical protein
MLGDLVWNFETATFRVECLMSPDDDIDTSFDETGETAANLATGLWSAFVTEVRVIHKDTGAVLGRDVLGGSIYERPLDFIRDYFPDMVRNAIGEARKSKRALCSVRTR